MTPEPPKTEAEDIDFGLALDSYDALDVARMELFVPGGTRSIGWVDFCGPGHPKAIQLSNETTRRNLRETRDRVIKGNRWKPTEKTPEEAMAETVKWVCDRIVGWSIKATAMDDGGQKIIVDVPFSLTRQRNSLPIPERAGCSMRLQNLSLLSKILCRAPRRTDRSG